ncbi:MAG TPA: class I SAM-dependent methyltransferase [Thermodesulfobacteriota bacterium]|nr:class I SAM-dependent methyltransferase [Thermodesulfobacteriota bacterium]
MSHRVCPWWVGYFLATPLRRLVHDPATILRPFVTEGMTVVEPGPGMGFFTMELARLVGRSGRVVAIDVQPKMLVELRRRAGKAGLIDRIEARHGPGDNLGIDDLKGRVDFVLAFAVIHELPSAERFFAEVSTALKPGRRFLMAEPRFGISAQEFSATLQTADQNGFRVVSRPVIRWARSAALVKV